MKKLLGIGMFAIFAAQVFGQAELPPTPSAPRATSVPQVSEARIANGLVVRTVAKTSSPLVTIEYVNRNGASMEASADAGLADFTASMLTKGTKTRTATAIAEQIEFLGGAISSGANWNGSKVVVTVTSDKLDAAMAILSDVVRNPRFDQNEINLLKQQSLDGLSYNLKQPGFLASYVGSSASFREHPIGGTPASLAKMTSAMIRKFYGVSYLPQYSSLIFSGDVTDAKARALAQKYFGTWPRGPKAKIGAGEGGSEGVGNSPVVRRITVVDLPDSGQAAVNFNVRTRLARVEWQTMSEPVTGAGFYPALVLNSVLGGGYSSRLNQEIRIKRGLSYGAGSSFAWRGATSNFGARVQTKNESAAEVASLIVDEMKRIAETPVPANELAARKLVLTGDFGRDTETTAGLAEYVAALIGYGLSPNEMTTHVVRINAVTAEQIRSVAVKYLSSGEFVIVGDYKVFKDDLAKRFPGVGIDVVPASKFSGGK